MHFITNILSTLKYEEVEFIRSVDLSFSLDTVKYLEGIARLNTCLIVINMTFCLRLTLDCCMHHVTCKCSCLSAFTAFSSIESKLQIVNSAIVRLSGSAVEILYRQKGD